MNPGKLILALVILALPGWPQSFGVFADVGSHRPRRLNLQLQSVGLAWEHSPELEAIATYRIYYGIASGSYPWHTNAGLETNLTVAGLVPGHTYYFAATAIGTNQMESEFSNEISFTVTLP